MPKNIPKLIIYLFITITLTLGLSISLQSLLAAWSAPTDDPPDDNISPLLNTGSTAQVKSGSLGVNNFTAASGVFSGNVGIGTTNPGSKLVVQGDNADIYLKQSDGRVSGYLASAADGEGVIGLNNAAGNLKTRLEGDGDSYFIGGNVGIGTTNPGELLDVAGDVRAQGNLYVGTGGGYFYNDSGSRVRINQDFYTNNGNTYLYGNNTYLGAGSGDNIRVRDNEMFGDDWIINYNEAGNWGIGVTSPGYTLEVAGDIAAATIYDRDNTSYYINPASTSITNAMRANIFYDRQDTSYYLDPASTSRLNYALYDNLYSYGWMQTPIFYDANNTSYYLDPAGVSRLNDIRPNIMYDGQNTSYYVDPAGVSRLNDIRPSVMYDGDNTSYYVNPAGTSVFNTINLGGVSRSSWPGRTWNSGWFNVNQNGTYTLTHNLGTTAIIVQIQWRKDASSNIVKTETIRWSTGAVPIGPQVTQITNTQLVVRTPDYDWGAADACNQGSGACGYSYATFPGQYRVLAAVAE